MRLSSLEYMNRVSTGIIVLAFPVQDLQS